MNLPMTRATDRRSTLPPRQTINRTINIAHRGASAAVAENTLAAMRAALARGADEIEVDVQRSKDGALVLMHDTTLARTTDVRQRFPHRAPWHVADFTHDELKGLDAGSWKSPEFAGEQVPTLDEAIEVVRQNGAGLLLELKAPHLYPGIVRDVVATLRPVRAANDARVVVQSFSYAAMKEHKAYAPWIPVGLLGTPGRSNLPALGTWADQVNPSHISVDKTYVDEVHAAGMRCLVWTVNRGRAMKRALRLGVDGVITNHPELFGRVEAAHRAG